jgi:hypothetical protein
MGTLFYSWQNDSPSNTNRNFIKDAAEKAIKNVSVSLELEEALRLDQDTKDIPGAPEIVNTILKKIDGCDIFLPDLTIVAKTNDGKQVPNPNVLIEYGYAMKAIGSERIIAVMNEGYGTAAEGLPFDLRHRRWPIRYSLAPDAKEETRKEQKKNLVSQIEDAIKAVLNSGLISQSRDTIQPVQPQWKSSSFLGDNRILAKPNLPHYFPGRKDFEVIWFNKPQAFLRLLPTVSTPERSPFELEKLIKSNPPLWPMSRSSEVYFEKCTDRNKYGAVIFALKEKPITNKFTQVFRNGEIWGIDASLFEDDHRYIASGLIEDVFVNTLKNYLSFAKDSLKLVPPLKFIAGLSGVEGFPITTSLITKEGHCIEEEIIYEGIIERYDVPPRDLLIPFFKRIWEPCGFDYRGSSQ